MLKKELTAALAMMGVLAPFAAHADQPMSTTGQGQQQPAYNSGEAIRRGDLPGAYNQDANYKIDDSYDVYFTADFIYWNLHQEMHKTGNLVTPTTGLFTGTNQTVFGDTSYKPGFQVGLGFNMAGMDGWNLYSEYTWYKNNTSHSLSAGSSQYIVLDNSAVINGASDFVLTAGSVSGTNKYYYNNLNVMLERPFYWGRKLTANFGWGLRALWISNTASATGSDLTTFDAGATSGTAVAGSASATFKQKSWALGPRFGLDTNWMLGAGFKLMANAATSVLYTRYTTLEGSLSGSSISTSVDEYSSYNALRAITETALGLGWGSYFGDNNDFHFDLSASYEFNVYWNQNMYGFVNNTAGPSNTYIHGLNVAARFDF